MTIWIEVNALANSQGKSDIYWTRAHWNIDETDSVSPKQMDALCRELDEVMHKHLCANTQHETEDNYET